MQILTDPGTFSTQQNEVKDIDIVLITHEHPDHLHVDSLKVVLKNNPNAIVITNAGVGRLLDQERIAYTCVEGGASFSFREIAIQGVGDQHAIIYESLPPIQNTGYFIADKLFYPGDAFTDPKRPVDVLALPVAGPWMKLSEAIEYAKAVHPNVCIPVHDGILVTPGPAHRVPRMALEPLGIRFLAMDLNQRTEII